MKTPNEMTPPTATVAYVAGNILAIVVAVASAITAVGPGVLGDIFSHSTVPCLLGIAAVITAAYTAYKAGAGRSFVKSVDGLTSVEVPVDSTVSVQPKGILVPPSPLASPQTILDPNTATLAPQGGLTNG